MFAPPKIDPKPLAPASAQEEKKNAFEAPKVPLQQNAFSVKKPEEGKKEEEKKQDN